MTKLDTLSKFFSTVNKLVYYLLNVVCVLPFIILANTIFYNEASTVVMIAIVVYIITMIVYYKYCLYYRKKHNTLNQQKLTIFKKILYVATTLAIIFISVILAAILPVIKLFI